MELICNELSFHPLANNLHEAESRFRTLFNTFKEANSKFGFKKIRFQTNLSEQSITENENFIQAVSSFSDSTLKNAALAFLSPPYFDDLTEKETEEFFKSEYKIVGNDCPSTEDPIGLPIAHIKSVPAISINSHQFWEKKSIEVKSVTEDLEISFNVPNINLSADINSSEMSEWADIAMSKMITNKLELVKFLQYTNLTANIQDDFLDQLLNWKNSDYKLYKYILSLMKDVELHPFTGGMGQTENLKNRGKEASKRITNRYPNGDRLSYTIDNDVVTFIACKGHYTFH